MSPAAVPEARINRAYDAISSYLEKKTIETEANNANQLLGDDEEDLQNKVQLIFVGNESFTGNNNRLQFKPLVLPIDHSLFSKMNEHSQEDFQILLILNDKHGLNVDRDDSESIIYKLINEDKIPIGEVITGKSLKTLYKTFEKKRELMSKYQLVLCDDSIITTMPKLLGGKFFLKNSTTPVPIRVSSSATTLYNSIKNFYNGKIALKIPRGTTLNVPLGDLQWWSKKELCSVLQKMIQTIITKYNIRQIFIKSNFSPVVPLYFSEKSIDILFDSKAKKAAADEDEESKHIGKTMVEIDGVEIELNEFNKSLMEIAQPEELKQLFAKQLKESSAKQFKQLFAEKLNNSKKRSAIEVEKETTTTTTTTTKVEEAPKSKKQVKKSKK